MATTVQYKGQVLVTVDNQTKVLETSGKWCEDDFTLTDVSGGGGDTLGESLLLTLQKYENSDIVTLPMTYAFSGRSSLTELKLPNLKSANGYMIAGCTGLTAVAFPKLDTFSGWQVFATNTNIETIDFLGPAQMQQQVFNGDTKLNTLILRRNSVVGMANINCFNGTPFASGKAGGTLYVPSALISSYQSASNWSTILGYANNQIKAIEGSIYETQYADGTPIS